MPRDNSITVSISGLEGMVAAANAFSAGAWIMLKEHLLTAAERVGEDTSSLYLSVNRQPDAKGAAGIVAEASARGAFTLQSIRKSEFPHLRRPNYGPRMMRKAFLPSLWRNRPYILLQAELAVEEAKALYWRDAPGTTLIV